MRGVQHQQPQPPRFGDGPEDHSLLPWTSQALKSTCDNIREGQTEGKLRLYSRASSAFVFLSELQTEEDSQRPSKDQQKQQMSGKDLQTSLSDEQRSL
ncbi:unnamed protein product [Sphagnum tenellum]